MKILRIAVTGVALITASIALPATAQQDLDVLKQRCDAYGFVRGTPEHADCVRKLDVQQAQMRCEALIQRGRQMCSKEFADLVSPVDAADQCGQVQAAYQQYCQ